MRATWMLAFMVAFASVEGHNLRFGLPEKPVAAFEAKSTNDPSIGRSLRGYPLAPESNRIEANIDKTSVVGQPVSLRCSSPKRKIVSCSWTQPRSKEAFGMTQLAPGVKGILNDDHNCHIQVESLSESQLGIWSCKLELEGLDQFQQAYLTATEQVPITDVRLPRHVIPESYNIYLTPFLIVNNFTTEGHVDITIQANANADNITLHIYDITIYENLVALQDVSSDKQVNIEGHAYDSDRQFYIVKANVVAGSKYRLSIPFLGQLNDDLAGFYRSTYVDASSNTTRYIATSQMEATDARRALPCFDEPALKAKFQVNIGRLPAMISISNMPIKHEGTRMADNAEYVWDEYEESLRMSTYLLAFVVADFKFRQGVETSNGVEFRIWSREEALPFTKYAADIGPKVLEYYEKYFNIAFPLPKQDMIAIPDFSAGAMENWGLITYRETALLFDPKVDASSNRIYVSTVVAHELAHQWFGDLVTMKWWDDLWLNEGFASYVETLGASFVEPDASIQERFCIDNTYNTFEVDSLLSSHPISAKVRHPDEINEIFDKISYGKGASIIRMMSHFLGEDSFVGGLTSYLNAHQYSNAEQDDLWQALTDYSHTTRSLDSKVSVKEIMDTWTLQMGYPVVHVERDYANNTMTLSQSRYLIPQIDKSQEYKWWIPISFEFEGGSFNNTRNTHWLSPEDDEITIELPIGSRDKAVIVNVQQTGYYRVNYDLDNWGKIIHAIGQNPSSVHRVNRGQVINDIFNLAKVGLVPYTVAFESTKSLFAEKDYIPWRTSLMTVSYIKRMFKKTQGFGYLKKYLTTELLMPFRSLGFDYKATASLDEQSLQADIVEEMCDLGYDPCESKASQLFDAWMATTDPDVDNPISPTLRKTVYCTSVRRGDETVWFFLWRRLKKANNANEKNTIMTGLACTNQAWLLQTYLDMTLDPTSPIRKQDGASVIARIASNQLGRFLAWNWMRNNWGELSSYFDTAVSSSISSMITSVTSDFNTPFELKELEAFYEEHSSELGTARTSTLNAIEKVQANVFWMDTYYAEIEAWLKKSVGEL